MPTLKQKKLAKNIVENLTAKEPKNKKELVVSAGYAEISAKSSAHLILEQEGVKEELKTVYGFDENKAKEVVAEILVGGENDGVKLKAADMIFKVHGSYAPEKHANLNLNVNEDSPALDEATQAYEQALRKRTIG